MTNNSHALPVPPHGQPQPAASREALRKVYRIVLAWFRNQVRDEQTALDLTQNTFLRFRSWQGEDPGRMPDNPEAFLLGLAEWVRRTHFSHDAKIRENETLSGDITDLAALSDGRLSAMVLGRPPVSVIPGRVDLGMAAASLPDAKRLALVMRFVDDRPTDEIAKALNVTPRRVNQLINEALNDLSIATPLAGYATPKGGHQ